MSAITTCPKCGALYEESNEEQANSPSRECMTCWARARTVENLAHGDLCHCVTCAIARKGDRRDAAIMLRATRIAGAGVSPRERIEWDAYIEARRGGGGYVPASPLGLLVLAADAQ